MCTSELLTQELYQGAPRCRRESGHARLSRRPRRTDIQLLHEAEVVTHGPVLDRFAILHAQDVDLPLREAPASRLDAHEGALVGPAHRRLQDDLVALRNDVVDGHMHVWKRCREPRHRGFEALGASGWRAWSGFVVDRLGRDKLVRYIQVAAVEHVFPDTTGERLVGVERHLRTLRAGWLMLPTMRRTGPVQQRISRTRLLTSSSRSEHAAFGALLKEFRDAVGLTQEALAERAGLSVRAISALERGVNRSPRRDTLDRLASALALSARRRERLLAAAYPNVDPSFALPAAGANARHLPLPPTPLLGREHEIDVVVAMLRDPNVRLITLTGPGGVGKTRLAMQVVEDLAEDFDDGSCFVELADLRDPDAVPQAIAQALSLREATGRTLVDGVLSAVASKHLLLVLDNFEHLPTAAPFVGKLLAAGPRVKILITSRARLRVRAEHEVIVPPLALPDAGVERPLAYPAVELFVQRAAAAGSSVSVTSANAAIVVEICRRLDGLPLAIELAASRTKVLPPQALLQRLELRLPLLTHGATDLPERQRTMRSTIAWSYELLAAPDQAVFRNLSVCVGGCSLEAAQAIAGADLDDADELLEHVAVLVDHSLVNAREDAWGEPRISMLEVIREFGLERLEFEFEKADEMVQARARHAEYYLRYAEAASPHLIGSPHQAEWLSRLEQEHGNMLAALRWAREHAAHQFGLRLASALGPFWYFRGYFSEGRHWLDTFLAATASPGNMDPSRIWLLYGVGKLATEQGDFARVREAADEALTLAQALGNAVGQSQALELQGNVARLQGDALGGRALLEQALLWARRAGDRGQLERVLFGLAHAARDVGDPARAELAFEELLVDPRAGGSPHGTARVLLSLAQLAQRAPGPRARRSPLPRIARSLRPDRRPARHSRLSRRPVIPGLPRQATCTAPPASPPPPATSASPSQPPPPRRPASHHYRPRRRPSRPRRHRLLLRLVPRPIPLARSRNRQRPAPRAMSNVESHLP